MLQQLFFGELPARWAGFADLGGAEVAVLARAAGAGGRDRRLSALRCSTLIEAAAIARCDAADAALTMPIGDLAPGDRAAPRRGRGAAAARRSSPQRAAPWAVRWSPAPALLVAGGALRGAARRGRRTLSFRRQLGARCARHLGAAADPARGERRRAAADAATGCATDRRHGEFYAMLLLVDARRDADGRRRRHDAAGGRRAAVVDHRLRARRLPPRLGALGRGRR